MPWNPAQHRLFEAVAHDPQLAKEKGIPQKTAAHMAAEGIRKAGKEQESTNGSDSGSGPQ
jgi:hypothetical protein